MTGHVNGHVVWPTDRFYWAILDTSLLPARRPTDEQLGFLFEATLPHALDAVHSVFTCGGHNCMIACGVEHTVLDQLTDVLTLTPAHVPEDPRINSQDVDHHSLNLLTGRHEPDAVHDARRRWYVEMIAAVALITLVVSLGIQRRRAFLLDQVTAITDARMAIYFDTLGTSDRPGRLPPEQQMLAELRRLRQTHGDVINDNQQHNAAVILTMLLERWPDDPELHLRTDSIIVAPRSITLQATAPTSDAAQALASALAAIPGWQADPPQLDARQGTIAVTVRLRLTERGAHK